MNGVRSGNGAGILRLSVLWPWLLLMTLPALACGLAEPPAPALTASQPAAPTAAPLFRGTPVAVTVPAAQPFAPFQEAGSSLKQQPPAYSFDSERLANPELLSRLNAQQQIRLGQLGFVVVAEPWPQLDAFYRRAAENGFPIFVSSGALLYTADLLFDATWQRTVEVYLLADLAALNQAMVEASRQQWLAAPPGRVKQAAWSNLAFFSVGGRLLQSEFPVPDPVQEVVADELSLVAQHAGIFNSPLFQTTVDYALFASEDGPFAQAMRWYRQMAFSLAPEALEQARLHATQGLLMRAALAQSQNQARLAQLNDIQSFFQGRQADAGMDSVEAVAAALFGPATPPSALAGEQGIDAFIASFSALPGAPRAFRWFPRPAQADAALLAELVFNQVGVYQGPPELNPFTAVETQIGRVRGLPHGLDVAAAFGSQAALAQIAAGGDDRYQGYREQLAAWQARIAGMAGPMAPSLHGGWLYSLQPLLASLERPPLFMQSPAWAGHQLAAWYAGWLLARHDGSGLLQAGPPAGQAAPLRPAAPVPGYVEPNPVLFARLAALTAQVRQGLESRDRLDKEMGQKLLRFERLLLSFSRLATLELAGTKHLAPADASLFAEFGRTLGQLLTFAGHPGALNPRQVAQVSDIYQEPQTGQRFQGAVGEAWPVYVIVPVEGQATIAVGAVLSAYMLKSPAGSPWSDITWAQAERPQAVPWMGLASDNHD